MLRRTVASAKAACSKAATTLLSPSNLTSTTTKVTPIAPVAASIRGMADLSSGFPTHQVLHHSKDLSKPPYVASSAVDAIRPYIRSNSNVYLHMCAATPTEYVLFPLLLFLPFHILTYSFVM